MSHLPEHLAAAFSEAFPVGAPRHEDYRHRSGVRAKPPNRARQTKPLNRKTFYVELLSTTDPAHVLAVLWELWQPGRQSTWVMTHGEVRDGVVRLLIEYTVIGGHPSDVRRKIGRVVRGVPLTEAECRIELRSTERV